MKTFLHKSLLKTMLLLCALIVGSSAWADTVTFSYGDYKGQGTSSSGSEYTMVKSNVSIKDTKFYGNTSYAQFYAGGTTTITPGTGVTITQIELTASSISYNGYQSSGTVTASNGSISGSTSSTTVTWTGSATSSFTISHNKQIRWTSIVVTYTVAAPAYTITAQSNNNSYGTVSLSGSLITATPEEGYTYADPAYSVSPANSATVEQNGDEFTVTPSANTTVTINFAAIPSYTVTLGDNNEELEEEYGGAGVDLPTRSDVGSYTFAGWSTTNVSSETTTAPNIISTSETYHPTANITLYPVYTRTEGGASTESSNIFASGSYDNGTITWVAAEIVSITQEQNGAQTAPNPSYVNNPRWYSGNLITITPSVSINSISVTATTEGYASALANSTYSNATANASGTGVTITPSNGNNPILITMSGQSRLSSLTVNYVAGTTYYISTPSGQEKVATPSITIPTGAFVSTKTVTINCETAGAAISYSTNNGESWTSYSAPFTINATTTVQAKATKSGMDDSDVATATFTKETVLEGLSALASQTNASDVSYYVNLTNAQVTWVGTMGNNSTPIGYLEDSNSGIYLYNVSATLNNVYNGIFQVTYQLYNSMPEIKAITAVEGTTTAGSAKAATVMAAAALDEAFDANLGRQIQINGVAVTSDKELTSNIALYETSPYTSVTASKTYNLVGYPFYAKVNNTATKQFRITSASEVQKQDNAIIMVAEAYTIDIALTGAGSVNMTSVAANHGTLQSEIYSSTIDAANYTWESNVLEVNGQNGVIVIRYFVDADAEYNGVEKFVTVTVVDDPEIAYEGETETTAYGTPYVVDADLVDGGDITLSSGNTAIATIDGLTITPVAVGSVTITINTAATDIWHAGSATFTLNVTAPEGQTTAPSGFGTLFKETFDGFLKNSSNVTTQGGNDNGQDTGNEIWSGNAGATSFSTVSSNCDESDWVIAYGGAGYQCAKFGSSNNKGSATTRSITVEGGKTYNLTFKAAPWNAESTTMSVTATNATVSGISTDAMSTQQWNNFNATVTVDDNEETITLTFTADKNRFFLDEVELTDPNATGPTVKTAASGYASYCCQYPIDLDELNSSAKAYAVTDVTATSARFTQLTGIIKGGVPFILIGTASTDYDLTLADGSTEPSTNLLRGTLAPTYVQQVEGDYTNFGLSAGTFVKMKPGTVKANKAFLPIPNNTFSGDEVKSIAITFEEATGIDRTEIFTNEDSEAWYDLSGRRVAQPTKGIYIHNGKKVFVK